MSDEILGEGRFLRLVRRDGWEHVERPGVRAIVVIVAVTPAGELLLVEQHRPPVGAEVIELPAGLVGDEETHRGEGIEEAARRELLEETGWEAGSFERLGAGPPSAGLSSEVVTLLYARDLHRRGGGGGTAGESIRLHAIPLIEVAAWLARRERAGQLVDPKVWAGLWFAYGRSSAAPNAGSSSAK